MRKVLDKDTRVVLVTVVISTAINIVYMVLNLAFMGRDLDKRFVHAKKDK